MNITLGQTHIKTLTKLQAIAEKHNCSISFGTNDHTDLEADFEDFKDYYDGLTEKICSEIVDNLQANSVRLFISNYWFELYDGNKKKYNNLTYTIIEGYAEFDEDYNSDDISEETQEFIENNMKEYDYIGPTLEFNSSKQNIRGFDGVDKSQINVYREGMLLKFFGDLVCDYLGEEKIVEVY